MTNQQIQELLAIGLDEDVGEILPFRVECSFCERTIFDSAEPKAFHAPCTICAIEKGLIPLLKSK